MAKVLMKGNEAIAEAAIHAGCKCFFGYPITPQTERARYSGSAFFEILQETPERLRMTKAKMEVTIFLTKHFCIAGRSPARRTKQLCSAIKNAAARINRIAAALFFVFMFSFSDSYCRVASCTASVSARMRS